MHVEARGWARNCGSNRVISANIPETKYLTPTLRGDGEATVMTDPVGTTRISINKKKLVLNGNYSVDLVLTREDIITLARMSFQGQDFQEIVRGLGKVESAPVYQTASA